MGEKLLVLDEGQLGANLLVKILSKKTRSLRVKSAAVPVTTAAGSGGKKGQAAAAVSRTPAAAACTTAS